MNTLQIGIEKVCTRSLTVTILIVIISFTTGLFTRAQQGEMSTLVAPLAKGINHSHKHRLVVLPFLGPDPKDFPLGAYLAKQISANLSSMVRNLETIDASEAHVPLKHWVYDPKALEEFVAKTNAEIVVTGSFSPFGNSLGISLEALKRGERKILAQNNGQIPLTPELRGLIPQAVKFETPADGIYRGGWGGIGMPECHSCPDPTFPSNERSTGREGIVVLNAVIGTDGRAHQIEVEKGTSQSFQEAAIKAVAKWKFQPAKGPDGTLVAVRIPIEVIFRYFGH
ncbi:MAG: TonB family protein [Candidatus Acidiferrales bacterium]